MLACIVVGLVIGAIGHAISGSTSWYLALPAAVAVGWMFVADPTECEPPPRPRARSGTRDDEAP